MAQRVRRSRVASVVVGCAVLVAFGCSDSKKKSVFYAGEGGEGGAAGALAAAGEAPMPEGGAAGAAQPAEAGQGGTAEAAGAAGVPGGAGVPNTGGMPNTGGTGGTSGTSGAGGSGGAPNQCVPEGSVTSILIQPSEVVEPVCRGARVRTPFTGTTAASFTCCGTSDTTPPYALNVNGTQNVSVGTDLAVLIPADAPLGVTNLSLTCAGGPNTATINFEVVGTLPPVVTGATSSISPTGTLTITGENLQDVSEVTLIPVSGVGSSQQCFYGDSISATAISCSFDGINPGDYYVTVQQTGCGYAVNTPVVTVTQIAQ